VLDQDARSLFLAREDREVERREAVVGTGACGRRVRGESLSELPEASEGRGLEDVQLLVRRKRLSRSLDAPSYNACSARDIVASFRLVR
jgi:hypothetical protein